jgi:hypothetical protein
MLRSLSVAIAVAAAVLVFAAPATAEPDVSCADGVCTYDDPSYDEATDEESDDWGPGPFLAVCAGFDTGIPMVGVGGCTPDMAG